MLAGPSDLVDQAREWRDRLGGKLHHAWPLALSAEIGLDQLVPRMPAFWERAQELAVALRDIPGVEVLPDPPQTPLFHVIVPVPPQALAAAHQRFVEREDSSSSSTRDPPPRPAAAGSRSRSARTR